MKQIKIHLLVIMLSAFSFSYGQPLSTLSRRPSYRKSLPSWKAAFLNPNVYRTRVDMKLMRISDKFGTPLTPIDTFILVARRQLGIDYKIISEDENGFMIIRVLPKVILNDTVFISAAASDTIHRIKFTNAPQLKTDSTNAYNYLFAIKGDELPPLSKILLSTKITGTPLIHPFKLRASASNSGVKITTDFTIGYTFGVRFKISKNPLKPNYFSIIPLGFGLGDTKYVYKTEDGSLSEEKDGVAVTYYSCGFLFSIDKINIGIFNGYDAMIGHQNDWIYQSHPWFSFGLGYKFSKD